MKTCYLVVTWFDLESSEGLHQGYAAYQSFAWESGHLFNSHLWSTLTSHAVLDAGDTVMNNTASCLHGYFSIKGEITKQVRAKGSSHILYHTHTYTYTMHSLVLILKNLATEQRARRHRENMNQGNWSTPRWEKNKINYWVGIQGTKCKRCFEYLWFGKVDKLS